MPARSSEYLEFLVEQMSPLGDVTWRSMFGGYCLYCEGIPFALVANHTLYLKADDANRPMFDARQLQPFRPFGGDQAMSYYEAPPEIFEDSDATRLWCGPSVEAGRRAQSKKKSRSKAVKR